MTTTPRGRSGSSSGQRGSVITLRDGSTASDSRLTRIPLHDPRSVAYGVAAMFSSLSRTDLVTKTWRCREVLNQGQEGACTGFAVAHELLAQPTVVPVDGTFAREQIYWEAQKLDPFPGGAYPGASPFMEGSTVLSAMKIAQRLGYITEYRWAFTVKDLAIAVGHIGPAVLGIPWYADMSRPNDHGRIHPTGDKIGGHAILCRGFDHHAKTFLLHNSWGPGWGQNGTAKVGWDDMATLLSGSGDACIPLKRTKVV